MPWLRPFTLSLPVVFCESNDHQADAVPPPVVCAACAQYNTYVQRLQWAHRDERCRRQPECIFVGPRMTGNCINADATALAASPSSSSSAPAAPPQAPPPSVLPPASLPDPMQLVNDQIQDTLTTTLRSSRLHAEGLAKSLVIANLQAPPLRAEFGKALGLVLSAESARLPTRGLVYWSLRQPLAVQAVQSQASWWTRYFLHPQFVTISGDSPVVQMGQGSTYTQAQVTALVSWWLQAPEGRAATRPLLQWSLRLPVVVDGVTDITTAALPYCKTYWLSCAKEGVREGLQSPALKAAAKESLLYYLKSSPPHEGKVAPDDDV